MLLALGSQEAPQGDVSVGRQLVCDYCSIRDLLRLLRRVNSKYGAHVAWPFAVQDVLNAPCMPCKITQASHLAGILRNAEFGCSCAPTAYMGHERMPWTSGCRHGRHGISGTCRNAHLRRSTSLTFNENRFQDCCPAVVYSRLACGRQPSPIHCTVPKMRARADSWTMRAQTAFCA